MKTNYVTAEDILFLEQVLSLASMHTERIFNPEYNNAELIPYRNELIKLRAKIYESLGYEDPNKQIIEWLQDAYKA